MVLEALASGLPVIGLDAQGTRDLVRHGATGLLLSSPQEGWPAACRAGSKELIDNANSYAELLRRVVLEKGTRREMSERCIREGIEGFTWRGAMEVSRSCHLRRGFLSTFNFFVCAGHGLMVPEMRRWLPRSPLPVPSSD